MSIISSHTASLPAGVLSQDIVQHADQRGWFAEMYRQEWGLGPRPVQWNLASSRAGTLRGVHVHLAHWDYLLIAQGEMVLGLQDLRKNSNTFGCSSEVKLSVDSPALWVIPPGVAHGFYFLTESTHIYGVSEYWDTSDELGCRWDDFGLTIPWEINEPILSDHDQSAGTLDELMNVLDKKFSE